MNGYFERIALVAIIVSLIASCDQEGLLPLREAEFANGLVGKWKLTALTNTVNGQTVDTYRNFLRCQNDDIYYYDRDGSFQRQAGATKCDATEPDILDSGTWKLDGKDLVIEIPGGNEIGNIELMTATTIIFNQRFDYNGPLTIVTATLRKQTR